jgi:hypothetical protein
MRCFSNHRIPDRKPSWSRAFRIAAYTSLFPIVLGALLLVEAGCSKPPAVTASWKAFSPPGGKFRILLPSEPVKQTPQTNTGFEAVTYRIVTALSSIAGMAVGYADQPRNNSFETNISKLLDKLRDQALIDLRGTLISEKQVKLGNFPGREFRASVPGGFSVRERIFLVNNRLYSLMIIAGAQGLDSVEAETFFNSFEILK